MCGIVGYIGSKNACEPILQGLQALEYRGYDSAGIVLIEKHQRLLIKEVGQVENLAKRAEGEDFIKIARLGIGHTRWATHGKPTQTNAHPHHNTDQTIFVVHNGIIENYRDLKARLKKAGYSFATETDTEVIAHLIDAEMKSTGDFYKAFTQAIEQLRGAYAVAATYTAEPDALYAAKLSSPLIVGVNKNEHIVASDPSAILAHTKQVIYLNDYDVARIKADRLWVKNLKEQMDVIREAQELDIDTQTAQLGDYAHFMLKEIYEAPQTILAATRGRVRADTNTIKLGGLESVKQQLRFIDRIIIIACGTSYYAGLVGEYLIEEIAGIPVEVQFASEFKYRLEPLSRSTAVLAISQSGETADTIAALEKVADYGVLRLGVVNVAGSTISRITDAGVYCHAGPELSVASTKAFIAQVTVMLEIALFLSRQRTDLFKPLLKELANLPDKAAAVLKQAPVIMAIAKKYANARNFLFIGRGYSFPVALEGALKLKEISYIHAEGYAAGELKHGPLALIDESLPTFAIAPSSELHEKMLSNIEEVKSRNGVIIALITKGDKTIRSRADHVIEVPKTLPQTSPVLSVIVLQLFAYFVAVQLGHNVDRPRNLAKSVTVE